MIHIEKLVKMLQAYLVNFTNIFCSNFGGFFVILAPTVVAAARGFSARPHSEKLWRLLVWLLARLLVRPALPGLSGLG